MEKKIQDNEFFAKNCVVSGGMTPTPYQGVN